MLVITLGDPYSVNGELLLTWIKDHGSSLPKSVPWVLVGSRRHLEDQAQRLHLPLPPWRLIADFRGLSSGVFNLLSIDESDPWMPAEHLTAAARGQLAVRTLQVLRDLNTQLPLAVVTAPIDKAATHAAGSAYPGQTEFFESLWQAQAVMTLAGPRLRVGLVTNHLALKDVPRQLDARLVETKILLLAATLRTVFAIAKPRIGVLGLNPHAGDGGLFGDEEQQVILPAIDVARRRLLEQGQVPRISGPLPADTAFYRAYHGEFDAVLAMYHDQGLGPLKALHFDTAVNISGGLPHLRVSPDHGPARDLFLQAKASGASFAAAMALACDYLGKGANP